MLYYAQKYLMIRIPIMQ